MSSVKTSTIVAAAVGTVVTGFLAYALYFDHRRRTDPEFRKALKRESRRQAKAAKEEAEAEGAAQRAQIKDLVQRANEEGFPKDADEKEAYFMEELNNGEVLCQSSGNQMEAALCFFKALKVYPQPRELITIYDRTVPKPILDILAEMIAVDPTISIGGGSSRGSDSGSMVNVDD